EEPAKLEVVLRPFGAGKPFEIGEMGRRGILDTRLPLKKGAGCRERADGHGCSAADRGFFLQQANARAGCRRRSGRGKPAAAASHHHYVVAQGHAVARRGGAGSLTCRPRLADSTEVTCRRTKAFSSRAMRSAAGPLPSSIARTTFAEIRAVP